LRRSTKRQARRKRRNSPGPGNPPRKAPASTRLVALLGRDGDSDASLTDVNEELAARIREGSLDAPREEILDHLRETLWDKLAIANPKYLSK
jgi:hypothetical protein